MRTPARWVCAPSLLRPTEEQYGFDHSFALRRPHLLRRFVFITGTSEHADYHGFIDELKAPVLTKPFDMADLQRVAREMLSGL